MMNKAMAPMIMPIRVPLDKALAVEGEDDVGEVEEEVGDIDVDKKDDGEEDVAEEREEGVAEVREDEEGIAEEVMEGEIALDEDVGTDEVEGAGEVRPP